MTDQSDFVFGVSQYTTKQWTFEQDIECFPQLEVKTIELCEYKLDANRLPHQFDLLAQSGLTVSSIQLQLHTIYPDSLAPEPKDPVQRKNIIVQRLKLLAPLLPSNTPFVLNTGIAPDGNFRAAHERKVELVRDVADYAAQYGMRLALEPLNPILMNENSFIWSIPQALQMIEEVGRPNVGICLDTWNNWQDPSLMDNIRACVGKIFVVQVSDWHTPRSFADRAVVGTGEIPLYQYIRAVQATGYSGPYTLEIFSDEKLPDSLWNADPRSVIERSKQATEQAWRDSGRT